MADKLAFQRQYRFSIAYENSRDPGYVTEKIVDAFAAGTVPIYWGDPLIKQEFNPDSFVCADDYPDNAALIDAIEAIDRTRSCFCATAMRRSWRPAAGRNSTGTTGSVWNFSNTSLPRVRSRLSAAIAAAGAASTKTTCAITGTWPNRPKSPKVCWPGWACGENGRKPVKKGKKNSKKLLTTKGGFSIIIEHLLVSNSIWRYSSVG